MIIPGLKPYLLQSAAHHSHLCPRQVLGVRIGLAGARLLGLELPRTDKRLLVIIETDGCFASGIEAVTGTSIGSRSLRVEDYGKAAAAFVDTLSGDAVRVSPRLDIRRKAWEYAPGEEQRYFAQLQAYQVMPEQELLSWKPVRLKQSFREILSLPGLRTCCDRCGEEIINERELKWGSTVLCRSCAGFGCYDAEQGELELPAADPVSRELTGKGQLLPVQRSMLPEEAALGT